MWALPLAGGLAALWLVRDYGRDLPRVPDLERWEATVPRTSVIVAADGTVVAELPFRKGAEAGHRMPVAFADIPGRMVQAVLAAEDVRFFDHQGVDLWAVARAVRRNYQAGRVVEGASTITQQVARNLLPRDIGRERTLRRKVREALLARRIEARYPKERIFEVYVNHVFLGAGAYGLKAAARAYFAKTLHDLDLAEIALIAGLAQAPGRADPYKNPDAAEARRNDVLERMARAGFIDAAELAAAQRQPIALTPPPQIYGTLAPWHTERARREVEAAMPGDYAAGGLRIETSALPVLAMAAETDATSWSRRMGKGREHGAPQVGALIWDHLTGYVEATVGGLSWQDSQFDRATQACRQPGSAFKPILYAAAIEADAITPGTALRDAPIAEYDEALDVHWKPTNSGRSFRGVVLAQEALAQSLNAPAVDVLDRVGNARVIELAQRLGISTDLADVRPMALGASCVLPLELAGAFATFARQGTRIEPVFVVRVTRDQAIPDSAAAGPAQGALSSDSDARVLLDRASPYDPTLTPGRRLDRLASAAMQTPERVLDQESAFLISSMLADVVLRGTATAARQLHRPSAGKTGTTNNNTDAWFVGYTGRVVAAVWVGHDDPSRTLGPRDDGAHAALPLWMELIELAEGKRERVPVPGQAPASLVRVRVDHETGFLAQPGAGGAVELYFKPGTEPIQHAGQIYGVPVDLGRASRQF